MIGSMRDPKSKDFVYNEIKPPKCDWLLKYSPIPERIDGFPSINVPSKNGTVTCAASFFLSLGPNFMN